MDKNVLPIAIKDDGPIDRPFVMNWASSQNKPKVDEPTSTVEDTAFSEVIVPLVADGVSETVSSTQSGIAPDSLVDTSF
jgi:hypothetical protein